LWIGVAGHSAWAIRFGAGGVLFTTRTEGLAAGWAERNSDGGWNDETAPGNTDSLQMTAAGLKIFSNAKSALLKSTGVVTASGGVADVDESAVTVCATYCGISGPTVQGAQVGTCFSVTFPRPFAEVPTHLTVGDTIAPDPEHYPYGVGAAQDVNVASFIYKLTKYGLFIQIAPTLPNQWTVFNRIFVVSQ